MRYIFLRLLLISMLTILILSCNDKKSGNKIPPIVNDEITNYEYLSDITSLTFSPSAMHLNNDQTTASLPLDAIITFAINIRNDDKFYPISFSLYEKSLPANLQFIPTSSTCKKSNQMLLPNEECTATFTISLDNISTKVLIPFTDGYNKKEFSFIATADKKSAVADVLIDPPYIAFGESVITLTGDRAKRTVNITNNTVSPITIKKQEDKYTFISPNDDGTIPSGGSKQFDILYKPVIRGVNNQIIKIGDKVLSLSGNAVEPSTAVNDIVIDIDNKLFYDNIFLDFGTVQIGKTVERKIKLYNYASRRTLSYKLITLPDNISISKKSTCGLYGGSLDNNESCDYIILFKPDKEGNKDIPFNIAVDDKINKTRTNKLITLKTDTVLQPIISFDPNYINFGDISLNSIQDNSSIRVITIQNNLTGNNDIKLTVDSGSGSKFKVYDNGDYCKPNNNGKGGQISAGGNCKLAIIPDNKTIIGSGNIADYIKIKADSPSGSSIFYLPISANVSDGYSYSSLFHGIYSDNFAVTNTGDYFIFLVDNASKTLLYNHIEGKWEAEINSGTAISGRQGVSFVGYNNKAYLFGGKYQGIDKGDLWSFDILKKVWQNIPIDIIQPAGRSNAQVNISDDTIYISGGNADSYTALYKFGLKIDDKKMEIMRTDGMVNYSANSLIVANDGILYKFLNNSVERYLIKGGTAWQQLADITPTTKQDNSSAVAIDNIIYRYDSSKKLSFFDTKQPAEGLKEIDMSALTIPPVKASKILAVGKKLYIYYLSTDNISGYFIYDTVSKSFDKVASIQYPLFDNASTLSTAIGHDIYFFHKKALWLINDNVRKFDKVNLSENSIAMPDITVDNFTLLSTDKVIYLIDNNSVDNKVIKFNPQSATLTNELSEFNFKDNKSASYSYHNNKIYAYAGLYDDGSGTLQRDYAKLWQCADNFTDCSKYINLTGTLPNIDNPSLYIDNGKLFIYNGKEIANDTTKIYRSTKPIDDKTTVLPLEEITLNKTGIRTNFKLFIRDNRIDIIGGNRDNKTVTCTIADGSNTSSCTDINIKGDQVNFDDMRSSTFIATLLYKYDFTRKRLGVLSIR